MIFLFPRWDMLVPWRVSPTCKHLRIIQEAYLHRRDATSPMPQECRDRLKDIRRGEAITVGQRATETYVWNGSGQRVEGETLWISRYPQTDGYDYEVKPRLNLHDFDDVFVDVTMSCCLSSCHRKTLADICHSKMPKRGKGIDGWNWTFNWFRFKDSNIFRWLEDHKKSLPLSWWTLWTHLSTKWIYLCWKKIGNILSFLYIYTLGNFLYNLPFMKHAELTTRISFWTLSILVNLMTHFKITKKAAS